MNKRPEKKYTLEDIAREAEVSMATASRAFNKSAYVSDTTRQRIMEIAERVHYHPSAAAQNLAYRRSGLVNNKGTVKIFTRQLYENGHSFYIDIVQGAINTLNAHGFEAAISEFQEEDLDQCNQWVFKDSLHPDGAIFIGTAPANAVNYFRAIPTPIVLLDAMPETRDIPWVGIDNAVGITLLMDHLLELGHRHIAFVGGPFKSYSGRERLQSFQSRMAEHGIDPANAPIFDCGHSMETAYKSWLQLLTKPETGNITAVLAMNDVIGVGIIKACQKAGLAVPERLSVASFDGSSFCDYSPVPITTVKVPTYEMGREAAQLIIANLKLGCEFHHRLSVRPQLITGQSTGPYRKTP